MPFRPGILKVILPQPNIASEWLSHMTGFTTNSVLKKELRLTRQSRNWPSIPPNRQPSTADATTGTRYATVR